MKKLASAVFAFTLLGAGAVVAQPHDDHGRPSQQGGNHGPAMAGPGPGAHPPANNARPGPAMSMTMRPPAPAANRGRPGPAMGPHHLPPRIAIPTAHHAVPMWRGRSFAIGDRFILSGFNGPTISAWSSYALTSPRPGTHWIYVDGWYLMVGNRTGRIFAEIPADY